MITRGYIIGKIVDDISNLKYQIESRNRLGLFDLTKFTEDFFRETLNIVYGLNLKNLNVERSNNPGLDLGDKKGKTAYQITSTKTTQKISDTLKALTPTQIQDYPNIKVFIVGEKQNSYSVQKKLMKSVGFDQEQDIVDLDDLLQEIIVLPTESLDILLSLFNREFRSLKIEFEIVDSNGNFASSLYNQLEKYPNQPPLNATKLLAHFDDDEVNLKTIEKCYKQLSDVPRASREMIAIIAERGKKSIYNRSGDEWGILPKTLEHLLRMSSKELEAELIILLDAGIIYLGEGYIEEDAVRYAVLEGSILNAIVQWCKDNNESIKTLFNTMDFTVLDS